MAGNRNQSPRPQSQSPLVDSAPRNTVIEEFDIPDIDGLHSDRTQDFGSVRTLGLRHLSPLQEKWAAKAAGGDPLALAFELARRAVAYVKSDVGGKIETFELDESNGSSASCWQQMGPKIRALAMQANAEISVPNEVTSAAFMASRRTLA